MMIYLVLNIENQEEMFVLNICTSLDKATELANTYKKNFLEYKGHCDDIIEVMEIELNDDVVFDAYGDN